MNASTDAQLPLNTQTKAQRDAGSTRSAPADAQAPFDAAAHGRGVTTHDASTPNDARSPAEAAADKDACPAAGCVCKPNAPICDGDRATTCDALGLGPTDGGTDCTKLHERCAPDGTCKAVMCRPEDTRCVGDAIQRCNEQGTDWQLWLTCDPQRQACADDDDAGADCVPGCNANAPLCDGDVLTVCLGDGSGPAPGGTSCSATGNVCDPISVSCKPRVCMPGTTYCKNGNVYQCVGAGALEQLFDTCGGRSSCVQYPSSAYCEVHPCDDSNFPTYVVCMGSVASHCRPASAGPEPSPQDCNAIGEVCSQYDGCVACDGSNHIVGNSCVVDICQQGQAACTANRITTCNADGSGFDLGGVDCAASAKVCDQHHQCAQQAVDTIGTLLSACTAYDYNGTTTRVLASLYRVDSDRHLTGISTGFALSASDDVTWFVYESPDGSTLTQVWTHTVTLPASDSAILVDSGPISVPLKAGNQYAIGVYAAGFDLHVCPLDPANGQAVSFGQYLETVYLVDLSTVQPALFPGQAAFQQLTTKP